VILIFFVFRVPFTVGGFNDPETFVAAYQLEIFAGGDCAGEAFHVFDNLAPSASSLEELFSGRDNVTCDVLQNSEHSVIGVALMTGACAFNGTLVLQDGSYSVRVSAWNRADLKSQICTPLVVDSTPPAADDQPIQVSFLPRRMVPGVILPTDVVTREAGFRVSWPSVFDLESAVVEFEVFVGTKENTSDLMGSVLLAGDKRSFHCVLNSEQSSLLDVRRAWITLKATNGAGIFSVWTWPVNLRLKPGKLLAPDAALYLSHSGNCQEAYLPNNEVQGVTRVWSTRSLRWSVVMNSSSPVSNAGASLRIGTRPYGEEILPATLYVHLTESCYSLTMLADELLLRLRSVVISGEAYVFTLCFIDLGTDAEVECVFTDPVLADDTPPVNIAAQVSYEIVSEDPITMAVQWQGFVEPESWIDQYRLFCENSNIFAVISANASRFELPPGVVVGTCTVFAINAAQLNSSASASFVFRSASANNLLDNFVSVVPGCGDVAQTSRRWMRVCLNIAGDAAVPWLASAPNIQISARSSRGNLPTRQQTELLFKEYWLSLAGLVSPLAEIAENLTLQYRFRDPDVSEEHTSATVQIPAALAPPTILSSTFTFASSAFTAVLVTFSGIETSDATTTTVEVCVVLSDIPSACLFPAWYVLTTQELLEGSVTISSPPLPSLPYYHTAVSASLCIRDAAGQRACALSASVRLNGNPRQVNFDTPVAGALTQSYDDVLHVSWTGFSGTNCSLSILESASDVSLDSLLYPGVSYGYRVILPYDAQANSTSSHVNLPLMHDHTYAACVQCYYDEYSDPEVECNVGGGAKGAGLQIISKRPFAGMCPYCVCSDSTYLIASSFLQDG